ncbi:MAG: helix-turn-helix domain-containing protein [Erysipelotrichaceae bacterium]|nr:helix-turn-helix domain-containing protein [Erysipelotrichaceae bacterium]
MKEKAIIDKIYARNIKVLREWFGETQEDLANAIHVGSRQTISKYETGESDPPFIVLEAIANRYNVTTDLLLNVELPDLKVDYSKFIKNFNIVNYYPICNFSAKDEDEYFKEAYNYTKILINIMNDTINGVENEFSDDEYSCFEKAIELYELSIREYKNCSSQVNMLFLMFTYFCSLCDGYDEPNTTHNLDSTWLKHFHLEMSFKISEEQKEFIAEYEAEVVDVLCILKKESKYYLYADYYNAFRYIIGFVDSQYNLNQLRMIGVEFMDTLRLLGNPYAKMYIRQEMKVFKEK